MTGVTRTYRRATQFAAVAWRRPAAAALAVLTGLSCFAITAGMRADLASRTRALHDQIAAAPSGTPTITATADWPGFAGASQVSVTEVAAASTRVHSALAAAYPLSAAPTAAWTAFETPERPMSSWPTASTPGALPVSMRLTYRDTYALHTRLIAGRRPAPSQTASSPAASARSASLGTNPPAPVEADLTAATAARLGARIGSVLTVVAADGGGLTSVRIVGLVAPTDPGSAFWSSDAALGAPQLERHGSGDPYWAVSALIGPDQADALMAGQGSADFRLWWGFSIATERVNADEAATLADHLESTSGIESALAYDPAGGVPVALYSPLTPLLRTFAAEQRTAALETAMPETSIGLIAAITALLLAYAVADGRRAEARLQRARGATVRFVVLTAVWDGCATTLPTAAIGLFAGLAAPGLTGRSVYGHVIVAALAVTVAPALFALLIHRPRKVIDAVVDPQRGKKTRGRRTVAQCALVVACVAGLDLARTQGLAPGGSINRYAAAAPVLVAAVAALAVVNALPVLLRRLHHRVVGASGVVGLLGVARAARRPAGMQIAAFVLSTAACTADLAVLLARSQRPGRFDPLGSATATALDVLAVAAVLTGCAAAALATRLGEPGRSADAARLSAMGLSTPQAVGIALVESAPLTLISTLIGAVATLPLLWVVRPALGLTVPANAGGLAVAALAIAVPAVALSGLIPMTAATTGRSGASGGIRALDPGEAR